MRTLTVRPGVADSVALADIDAPPADGAVLVDGVCVGLCGTDSEIVAAKYGEAPPDADHLALGHENLGRVAQAPPGSGLAAGDLVVGIVRRPDPVPCPACAAGEWDMCRNGRPTEHGIKGLHEFACERWRAEPDALVRLSPDLAEVGVLLEPTTIVSKRGSTWTGSASAFWAPEVVAVTGAGPVGLLAALLGVQRGLRVHGFDRVSSGPKPQLVADLGATYQTESLPDSGIAADVTVECTGVPSVIVDAMTHSATDAAVCLTGVSSTGTAIPVDIGEFNRKMVLRNDVLFGSVNANRRHYEAAAALSAADRSWLGHLITRRVPLSDFRDAFTRRPDDAKIVLELL